MLLLTSEILFHPGLQPRVQLPSFDGPTSRRDHAQRQIQQHGSPSRIALRAPLCPTLLARAPTLLQSGATTLEHKPLRKTLEKPNKMLLRWVRLFPLVRQSLPSRLQQLGNGHQPTGRSDLPRDLVGQQLQMLRRRLSLLALLLLEITLGRPRAAAHESHLRHSRKRRSVAQGVDYRHLVDPLRVVRGVRRVRRRGVIRADARVRCGPQPR
mmetsp:Transcript_58677/g.156887  ORF Transcript_58677/g.156887 Transcript_58677/m.156887 type:complete len:211 (+) Transcript_58677:316-948(+)